MYVAKFIFTLAKKKKRTPKYYGRNKEKWICFIGKAFAKRDLPLIMMQWRKLHVSFNIFVNIL